ncbi:hypothetical protein M501DRAFT_903373, partial [Patellaria atrata CBS 101060]
STMASSPTTVSQSAAAPSRTMLATQAGPSRTTTATSTTLRLRAERTNQRHISWADDVVDNEGMGKKSSKVCCIYHKPHSVEESSDDSSDSSSSDSGSDSEPDNSTARPAGGSRNGRHIHSHSHGHGGHGTGKARRPSPNAYERVPK